MTNKRIGRDFTAAHDNTTAWNLHRRYGMALTSAFRAVHFSKQEAKQVNPFFLKRSLGLGLRPHC